MNRLFLLLALYFSISSQPLSAQEDRDDRPNRLMLLGGIASPVGALGLAYERMVTADYSVEAGIGAGIYGRHGTLNNRLYYGVEDFRSNVLLGLSYSGGRPSRRASSDENGDGSIGRYANTPDMVWANFAVGFDLTNEIGLIWGMDFGLTAPVAIGLWRPEEKATEAHGFCDMIFLCAKPTAGRYQVLPSITLSRFGYAF